MVYLWVKAFHLIAVVSWFAGLFYLPRLFVYHAMTSDLIGDERFQVMERKLYRGIMLPAAITTTLLGLWMLHLNPGLMTMKWLHAKLSLVFGLWGYQFYLNYHRKQFSHGKNKHSHVFFRWINEIPTVALIAIVILSIIKPSF